MLRRRRNSAVILYMASGGVVHHVHHLSCCWRATAEGLLFNLINRVELEAKVDLDRLFDGVSHFMRFET